MGSNPPTPHGQRSQSDPNHQGQHPNCRPCGTNPRATGNNPRGLRPPDPPDPETAQIRAQEQLMAENAARLAELEQTPPADPDTARHHLDRIRTTLRHTRKERSTP